MIKLKATNRWYRKVAKGEEEAITGGNHAHSIRASKTQIHIGNNNTQTSSDPNTTQVQIGVSGASIFALVVAICSLAFSMYVYFQ